MTASGSYIYRGYYKTYQIGDRIDGGVALSFRAFDSDRTKLFAFTELTARYMMKSRDHEETIVNSGGLIAFWAIGMRLSLPHELGCFVSKEFPVLQMLNEPQQKLVGAHVDRNDAMRAHGLRRCPIDLRRRRQDCGEHGPNLHPNVQMSSRFQRQCNARPSTPRRWRRTVKTCSLQLDDASAKYSIVRRAQNAACGCAHDSPETRAAPPGDFHAHCRAPHLAEYMRGARHL